MANLSRESENLDCFLNQVHLDILETCSRFSNQALEPMVQRCFAVRGKLTRPKAIYSLAEVLGVEPDAVLPWATSCELLHGASLVHDDLQDGDLVRRGQPTMWKVFGSNMAINLGDFLLLIAANPILNSKLAPEMKVELQQDLISMATKMIGGQCEEFQLNQVLGVEALQNAIFQALKERQPVFLEPWREESLGSLRSLYNFARIWNSFPRDRAYLSNSRRYSRSLWQ